MKQLRATELAVWLHEASRPQPAADGPQRLDAGRQPPPNAGSPQLLDVREPWEVEIAPMPGAVHIPMREVPARHVELDAARPVVCVCHHGVRSLQVALFLQRQGFETLNLAGGVDAWAREVDPAFPTY